MLERTMMTAVLWVLLVVSLLGAGGNAVLGRGIEALSFSVVAFFTAIAFTTRPE